MHSPGVARDFPHRQTLLSNIHPSPPTQNNKFKRKFSRTNSNSKTDTLYKMSQVVHNLGITYGNNNSYCGNTTNSYNQCNISIPDEKRQILEWISPFASRERHQAVRDSRVEKVGDWLLCNQDFSIWRTSEDRMAKPVLFCYGHPGAGKTYIRYEPPWPPIYRDAKIIAQLACNRYTSQCD